MPDDTGALDSSHRVGSWRVGPMLACGGLGMVFLARQDAAPWRRGVLKVLRPDAVSTPADVEARKERFEREAEALTTLAHRGFPPVLDAGSGANGMPYLVQEHVVGDTLAETLRRAGRLDARDACRIVDELVDVLLAARRLGVAHHDVRPDNIVLTEGGAVLVDWGLPLDDDATRLTQAALAPGALGYLGPEVFGGLPADPWKREVYALGVVLVECLSGEPAFPETAAALVARKRRIPSLEAPEGCVPALASAIQAATVNDPAARVDLGGLRALLAPVLSVPELPAPNDVFATHPTLEPSAPIAAVRRPSPTLPARGALALVGGGALLAALALGVGLYTGGTFADRDPDSLLTEVAPAPPAPAATADAAEVAPPPSDDGAPPERPRAREARPTRTPPAEAATVDGCTGGVTLPRGRWRLRSRDGEALVEPTPATPCGRYKLMEWSETSNAWDARKNVVVREDRVLVCDERLRCSQVRR